MELVTVSYSGLMMYENCPSSFQRKYVTKEEICHEYEPSKQSMRGSRIHNGIDAYLKDYDIALPEEVKKHERLIAQLKEDGAESEKRFAFNEEWVNCGFTCETARIRGVIDVVVLRDEKIEVIEWKTGRKYPDHVNQRGLYGLAGLLMFPEIEVCTVQTFYLDGGEHEVSEYTQGMLGSYKWLWERKINKCQPPQPYPQRPNFKCRWCPYSKQKGGLCPN